MPTTPTTAIAPPATQNFLALPCLAMIRSSPAESPVTGRGLLSYTFNYQSCPLKLAVTAKIQ
jgi:hypothetical protein